MFMRHRLLSLALFVYPISVIGCGSEPPAPPSEELQAQHAEAYQTQQEAMKKSMNRRGGR